MRHLSRSSFRTPERVIAALMAVLIGACDSEPDNRPYLEFVGGGFIFNYRLATADYGFVAQVARPGRRSYVFRTPPLTGVKSDHDYHVELRVLAADGEALLARYTNSYRSTYDQADLPAAPLAPGPGYHQPIKPPSTRSEGAGKE